VESASVRKIRADSDRTVPKLIVVIRLRPGPGLCRGFEPVGVVIGVGLRGNLRAARGDGLGQHVSIVVAVSGCVVCECQTEHALRIARRYAELYQCGLQAAVECGLFKQSML
jgi:hypothetical protein